MAEFDINNLKKGNRKQREAERARRILAGKGGKVEQNQPIKEDKKTIEKPVEVKGVQKEEVKGLDIAKVGGDKTEKNLILRKNLTKPDTFNGKTKVKRLTKKQKEEQDRTIQKKKLFLEYWNKTLGSVAATCLKAEISRETFYQWRREDREFYNALNKAKMMLIEDARQNIARGVQEGDMHASELVLKNLDPDFMPRMKLIPPTPGEQSLDDEFAEFENGGKIDRNGNTNNKETES